MTKSLASRIVDAPKLRTGKARPQGLGALDADPGLAPLLAEHPKLEALLLGLAGHSPFLWRLAGSDPKRLAALLDADPQARFDALLAATLAAGLTRTDEAGLMRDLRLIRQEVALLLALADIGGVWDVVSVTAALSAFADAALRAALSFCLLEAHRAGKMALADAGAPETKSGIVVFALGKHGARELNYSSDIDIVVLYDPDRAPLVEGVEPAPFFVRVVKGIVRLLQERTGEGHVFRVDLRLRPDPGSTPVAIAFASAFSYYESVGQNWERAALIKARAVAGDLPLGEAFLADLAPFIWRKYFDFAAISDIHAMKRQIHAVRGHDAIAVAGHDIKLGRGGIREIEFFVQTQQLVFGGRRPALRGSRTLDMLVALQSEGWITPEARDALSAAYRFLRGIEHRLQMVADEQTQRLPSDDATLNEFARFCGYSGTEAFSKALKTHARLVERHYARLFEEGADLASREGNLVFTGTVDDPDTLETLRRMGFSDPARATETVRGWHFGRRAAVTSARAREVLTELVPLLLDAFGKSADPDGALASFDRVLGGMPAAVELFSILREHRAILALFADILGSAPRLADIVAGRPHLLDAIIDPAFVEPFPPLPALIDRIAATIGQPDAIEDFLDRIREAGQHEMFLVGVRMLSGVLSPAMAGEAYAAIAEALIRIALAEVEQRFAREHGRVRGGRMAVLGMGRLGSREMTATSDLDLIVLYDVDPEAGESDGPRPLDPVVYYSRLTQRLISALTVPTRRGLLYAVDMRLRPSGNKGPAATQYRGFLDYHAGAEAETWEHLALVRARVVAGDPAFTDTVAKAVRAILARARDEDRTRRDAAEMRALIETEKGRAGAWELKRAQGGLIDIEFVAQTLVLTKAHLCPDLARGGTGAILECARGLGLLDVEAAATLIEAYGLMRDLFQWQRAMIAGEFDPKTADRAFLKRLASIAGLPDFKLLSVHLEEVQRRVRAVFDRFFAPS